MELKNIRVEIPPQGQLLFELPELKVAAGERVLIQGPSGRGKTTLLHIVAGLLRPQSGSVKVGGQDLGQMTEPQRSAWRRDHLALVFQKLNLLPHLTSLENVMLMRRHGEFVSREEAQEALAQVKMSSRERVLAAHLSLGEQQRVAVARVLVASPQLILADEPTSSLDDFHTQEIIEALLGATGGSEGVGQNKARGPQATLVVVSHDHRLRQSFTRHLDFDQMVKA